VEALTGHEVVPLQRLVKPLERSLDALVRLRAVPLVDARQQLADAQDLLGVDRDVGRLT
jgi:hypothetical protein